MKERILFVDEDESYLLAYQRSLAGVFEVVTATTGRAGLEKLAEESFRVVFVDSGMRRQSAADFVRRCAALRPRAVVVVVTTLRTLERALAAVNAAKVYRIVYKPLSIGALRETIRRCLLEGERLETERTLRDSTAKAAIESWLEFLRCRHPDAFRRSQKRQKRARLITRRHDLGRPEIVVAALLSEIGRLVEEPGDENAEAWNEWRAAELAEPGADLVETLPRFEATAKLIRYQAKYFDGSGPPDNLKSGPEIPRGARLLHILLAIEPLERHGLSPAEAFAKLRAERGRLDPRLLQACEIELTQNGGELVLGKELSVDPIELQSGDLVLVNVHSRPGSLLLASGVTLTPPMIESLRRQARLTGLRRAVFVERFSGPGLTPA